MFLEWEIDGISSSQDAVVEAIKGRHKDGPTGVIVLGPDDFLKSTIIGIFWRNLPRPTLSYLYESVENGFADHCIVFERPFWGSAKNVALRDKLVSRFREAGAKHVIGVSINCDLKTDGLDLAVSVKQATGHPQPA